jgi:acid phosphatase
VRLPALLAACGLVVAGLASPATAVTRPTKVLLVVDENHSAASARSGMPYLASLGRTYGYTTAYRANGHPSLPNYLALAGGSTFGVRDDNGPSSHRLSGRSVFDQALAAGRTAKTYAESMPGTCALASSGKYAVKHNPWAYFADPASRSNCRRFDVTSGTPLRGPLRDDVLAGTLPNVGLLVPNVCSDAHDCSLATADDWLKSWLTFVMKGPDYRAGRLAIVVTFDEDDYSSGNTVLTTVVSPYTHGVVSGTAYSHYSWTHYAEIVLGVAALRDAGTAPSLRPAFGI